MTTATKQAQNFDEIEALLPWHAAGTLSLREAAMVDEALASDKELAARFELVREELGETVGLNETLGAPSARPRDKLFAMIDAEPARKPRTTFSFTAWMTGFVSGFQPRTLAYGATAAALALVLQGAVLTGLFVKERQASHQLASFTAAEEKAADGSFVLVRFNPQANVGDITRFLGEHKAAVVGGPAAGSGLFRVQVSDNVLSQAELAAVVKKMAQSPVVGFTVPAAQP
jgi:anti-sigma-K factor RskA